MTPSERLDATFLALADPTRRALLARLAEGEASVAELAQPFAMSQPAISKHLKMLERAGLVGGTKSAQRRPRHIDGAPLAEVNSWLERYRDIWETNFQRLDALLDEIKGRAQGDHHIPIKPVETTMKKMTACLWFDGQAEEAMDFYCSVFENSKKGSVTPGPDGKAITVLFEIEGQSVMGLNGGPMFKPSEAFSFYVDCKDQQEVDTLWQALTADGGAESMCGWLKDKFGVSWQIIPSRLGELMRDEDHGRAGRAMQAMLQMRKIDVAALERAAAGA